MAATYVAENCNGSGNSGSTLSNTTGRQIAATEHVVVSIKALSAAGNVQSVTVGSLSLQLDDRVTGTNLQAEMWSAPAGSTINSGATVTVTWANSGANKQTFFCCSLSGVATSDWVRNHYEKWAANAGSSQQTYGFSGNAGDTFVGMCWINETRGLNNPPSFLGGGTQGSQKIELLNNSTMHWVAAGDAATNYDAQYGGSWSHNANVSEGGNICITYVAAGSGGTPGNGAAWLGTWSVSSKSSTNALGYSGAGDLPVIEGDLIVWAFAADVDLPGIYFTFYSPDSPSTISDPVIAAVYDYTGNLKCWVAYAYVTGGAGPGNGFRLNQPQTRWTTASAVAKAGVCMAFRHMGSYVAASSEFHLSYIWVEARMSSGDTTIPEGAFVVAAHFIEGVSDNFSLQDAVSGSIDLPDAYFSATQTGYSTSTIGSGDASNIGVHLAYDKRESQAVAGGAAMIYNALTATRDNNGFLVYWNEAAAGPATVERSAAFQANAQVASSGYDTTVSRSADLTARGILASASQRVLLRSTDTSWRPSIASAGQALKLVTRSTDFTARVAIGSAQQRVLVRASAVVARGSVTSSGQVVHVFSRALALAATGQLAVGGFTIRARVVGVAATAAASVSGAAWQEVCPSADSVDGAWTTDTGGTNLAAAIDDLLTATPQAGVLDDFNRADENPIGGNWTLLTGLGSSYPAKIANSRFEPTYANLDCGAFWTPLTVRDAVECYVDVAVAGTSQTADLVLFNDAAWSGTDGIWLTLRAGAISGNYFTLRTYDPGQKTYNFGTVKPGVGDAFGYRLLGNIIQVLARYSGVWTLLGTFPIGDLAESSYGVGISCFGDWALDNFGAGIPLDIDYIHSGTALPTTCRIKLAAATAPVAGTRKLRYRAGGEGGAANLTVALREGGGDVVGAGTLVQQFVHNGITDVALIEDEITGAITDYSNLYVELTAS